MVVSRPALNRTGGAEQGRPANTTTLVCIGSSLGVGDTAGRIAHPTGVLANRKYDRDGTSAPLLLFTCSARVSLGLLAGRSPDAGHHGGYRFCAGGGHPGAAIAAGFGPAATVASL